MTPNIFIFFVVLVCVKQLQGEGGTQTQSVYCSCYKTSVIHVWEMLESACCMLPLHNLFQLKKKKKFRHSDFIHAKIQISVYGIINDDNVDYCILCLLLFLLKLMF